MFAACAPYSWQANALGAVAMRLDDYSNLVQLLLSAEASVNGLRDPPLQRLECCRISGAFCHRSKSTRA